MKLLNEIIEECVQSNMLFTVHDIIPEAKSRGCKLSNESIAEYIKNYRYPIYYMRTLKELGCEIIIPVYHPADKDIKDYDASDLMPNISANVISDKNIIDVDNMIDTLVNNGTTSSTENTTKCLFDKRGRYHIRVSDVKKAGFDIGEKVSIMLDTSDDTIVVTNKRQSKRLHQVGSVKVDIYSNISVARSPFRQLPNESQPSDLKVKSIDREIKLIPMY